MENLILNFVWNCKGPQIAKTILKKKNEIGRFRFLKNYYKAARIKIGQYWHKDRSTDRWNGVLYSFEMVSQVKPQEKMQERLRKTKFIILIGSRDRGHRMSLRTLSNNTKVVRRQKMGVKEPSGHGLYCGFHRKHKTGWGKQFIIDQFE